MALRALKLEVLPTSLSNSNRQDDCESISPLLSPINEEFASEAFGAQTLLSSNGHFRHPLSTDNYNGQKTSMGLNELLNTTSFQGPTLNTGKPTHFATGNGVQGHKSDISAYGVRESNGVPKPTCSDEKFVDIIRMKTLEAQEPVNMISGPAQHSHIPGDEIDSIEMLGTTLIEDGKDTFQAKNIDVSMANNSMLNHAINGQSDMLDANGNKGPDFDDLNSHPSKATIESNNEAPVIGLETSYEDCVTPYPSDENAMPIAIIGMSCRFPGDATNPSKLWDLLAAGRSAWSPIPPEKFNVDAFYHPDPDRHGSMNVKGGYFLKEDVSFFDAPFFNISQNEAKALDPQQRLQLEAAYEALENAGLPLEKISGSDTGVYVGVLNKDYADLDRRDPEINALYMATGTGPALLSNRISYSFNLKGPSLTIDTACSASLVALHLGCQSLRTGESKQAIIGGTNMMINPDVMISMSLLGFLSPDGKSYTYDHRANGYARGEGVASIVIKPLEDALRDGDPVRAVIRGTAVNSDGRTTGITLPSRESQADMIRSAYRKAGLDPCDTGYVEAHGTGTKAGDSLEAGALADVFGPGRHSSNPLYVGSIKTNCGHLEGASGLAGIIKATLILEKGQIPPNLNFEKANERIPLQEWKLKVPLKLERWPNDGPRRASINSFGYGGTNAHVILDEVNAYLASTLYSERSNHSRSSSCSTESEDLSFEGPTKLFVFTANNEDAGKRMMTETAHMLKSKKINNTQKFMDDLAFTLAQRRSILPWKTAVTASSLAELIKALSAENSKFIRSSRVPKIGFIFTGQGAQWAGMGRELFGVYDVFDKSLQQAEKHLNKLGAPWSLAQELLANESFWRIDEPAISQPLCTAIQIALIELLSSWNIHPTAVTGHSSGEIAAAYCAGVLSLESAMTAAYYRGLLSSRIAVKARGGMIAVGLSHDKAETYISQVASGSLVVACVNSPSSVTVSGDLSAIDELQQNLEADNVFSRKLKVDVAYHSQHMYAIAQDYLMSLKGLEVYSSTGIEFYSSVSGLICESTELGADYWVKNMVSPVLFSKSLRNMCIGLSSKSKRRIRNRKLNLDALIEIGPHSALAGPVKQTLATEEFKDYQVPYSSCLVRNSDAVDTVLDVASMLFVLGYPVELGVLNLASRTSYGKTKVLSDLPPYSWNHTTKYWHESRLNRNHRLRPFPRLDLLGAPVADFNPIEPEWRGFLRVSELPWVKDHQVQGSILYPGAGMMIMAIEAMRQISTTKSLAVAGYTLKDVSIGKALVIPDTPEGIETKLTLRPVNASSLESSEKWQEFRVFTVTREGDWTEHCRGCVAFAYSENSEVDHGREVALKELSTRQIFAGHDTICDKSIDARQMYEGLETIGLCYGPPFQNVVELRGHENKSIAVIRVSDTASLMPREFEFPHLIHPATLDAAFHTIFPALTGGGKDMTNPLVPTFIKHMFVSSKISSTPGHLFKAASTASWKGTKNTEASITVVENHASACETFIEVTGLRCSAISHEASSHSLIDARKLCFKMIWEVDVDMPTVGGNPKVVCPFDHDDEQSALISNIEAASYFYVKAALDTLTEDDVQNMHPYHQTFYKLMQSTETLVQQGKMEHQTSHWLLANKEEQEKVFESAKASGVEGQMLCRMGENLVRVMRKEIEPLSLMLEDNLLFDYYGSAIGTDRCYELITGYLKKLSHKHPALNILEIGAGTGGATLPVLQTLGGSEGKYPRFSHYDFTDISSGFFEKAQEKFKAWESLMSYRKLNIEHDPKEDGFEYGKYDLIIAANVLHATKSMETTMLNVQRLLKPGGRLILMEATHLLLRGNVIFGNLPGWWLGAHEGRINGPMLTENKWDTLLRKTGFSGIDVCLQDFPDKLDQSCSIMVSEVPRDPLEEHIETVIIGKDEAAAVSVDHLATSIETLTGSKPLLCRLNSLPVNLSGKVCIFLEELVAPILYDASKEQFENIRTFVSASKGILWVTRGGTINSEVPEANLAPGLARSLRSENQARKLITFDLDSVNQLNEINAAKAIYQLFKATFNDIGDIPNVDLEFSERNGQILIPRVVEDAHTNLFIAKETQKSVPELQLFEQPDRPLRLEIEVPGLMDTLRFVDDPRISVPLADDEVEIKLHATGLNFRDIMLAMGQLLSDFIGCECSGVITKCGRNVTHLREGARVCAWSSYGAFSTHLHIPAAWVQPIPDEMSFEEGATIPTVYCTAYLALIDTARLQKGESVLIHAAAGGVGQAAIMISKIIGAEIFVTVGTLEKKKFIMEKYEIPEDRIFSSRDTSFAQGIQRVTNGKGVDVVLNSLAGELLRETWNCIALFGRFIEIGKRDIEINTKLDMAPFQGNVTFASVDLWTVFSCRQTLGARLLADVMTLLREKAIGHIYPLTVYPMSEIETAFRTMQAGKHLGKLVLKHNHDALVKVIPQTSKSLKFKEDVSYLLVGGLGGLGRAVSTWMVENGAKNLIFLSRSGTANPKAKELVSSLEDAGVRVAIQKCDVGDASELATAVEESQRTMPPIRGIIHGGMVLKDSIFDAMPYEFFQETLRPKIKGTKNLHRQFENAELDFFVIMSSSGGLIGNPSQGNYAASSTFQDAFAHYRTAKGLPVVSLDLGAISQVGFIAENADYVGNLERWGYLTITGAEFLAIIKSAIVSPMRSHEDCQVITGLGTQGMVESLSGADASDPPFWFSDAKFLHLLQLDQAVKKEGDSEGFIRLQSALPTVESVGEASQIICDAIITKMSKMLVLPVENIDATQSMAAYGVDSLVAVELRNWLAREAKADVPIFELLGKSSLQALSGEVALKSKLVSFEVQKLAELEQI